ncbi:trk system potassium uptake protein [Candidatus Xenohaliotis californiensis]|uniref:Trk system potassium uptake protein n=1 Tax=Candidatus Xenohaliotis californiensis TaxID=84677 RepID=A0ABM9N9G0_9RICK|nr:trk system potassium uptake protein [Candidatus Xenohaliotis californiensis]
MRINVIIPIVGPVLIILAIMQLVPILINADNWMVYVLSANISAIIGLVCVLTGKKNFGTMSTIEISTTTTVLWIMIILLSSIPFIIHPTTNMSFANALFETTSGLTTTGSTIIDDMNRIPKDILLWRITTNFIGGIGVVIGITCTIFRIKLNNMQLFSIETSDSEVVLPNHIKTSSAMIVAYIALIILCTICYALAGMHDIFNAISYAITTVSTTGFSNNNQSIGQFHSISIEYIAIIFMILSSSPLTIYLSIFNKKIKKFYHSEQIKYYIITIVSLTAILALWVSLKQISYPRQNTNSWAKLTEEIFRHAIFGITSLISTTGFTGSNHALWAAFPTTLIFFLTFIGGCGSSTAGGIKFFRIMIMLKSTKNHILKMIKPGIVKINKIDGKIIDTEASELTHNFFFLFIVVFAITTIALTINGVDGINAMSAAIGALSNAGSGINAHIQGLGNYSEMNNICKYTLSITMLIGRLEIFNVIAILAPYNWHK